MAKKHSSSNPNNMISLPQGCPVEGCGKKAKRAGFCEEHFNWFKAGLVNRKGEKPSDFDKKLQSYQRKKAA
ncbi:MAG: hypothetical protein D6797_08325 [Bdellovibrio sp.]|nr:MAG: hypothetical protein D6797_08325 [Bdellovibrio sp.]